MEFLLFVSRVLFSIIFLSSGFGHLKDTAQMSQYAASKGIPVPKFSVFLSGIMLLLGGLSILLGFWVNIGAWLLIAFLLPAAFLMHNFWAIDDPEQKQNEQIHFFKDLALAGAAFFIWYLYVTGGGAPWSLDPIL